MRMEAEAWVGMKNRNMKNLKFGLDAGFFGLLYNLYMEEHTKCIKFYME